MVHLVHDTNGGRQSYQSTWMSRWMRTSCNMTGKSLDYSSNATADELNRIAKDILVTSRSVKGLGMIQTVTSELANGGQRPQSLRNERSRSNLFKDGPENDDKGASAHKSDHKFECGEGISLKNGIQFQPVLYGVPAAKDTSRLFLDAVASKNNRLGHANLRILEHKGCGILSQPTDLLDSDKEKDRQSQSNISMNDSFRESNTSLLFHTPSLCDHHDLPKVQKFFGHGPSPSQYIASEKTRSQKKSCFECYSLHKLPHCVHDAETMKISNTLDSVEGGVSQTSNILLIKVNSGARLPKKCGIVTTRRVSTEINRIIASDLHRLLPFSSQGKRKVILDPLTCSADSEGRGNAGDIENSKVTLNKVSSSAETDSIDMNFSKETKPLLGGHSASSDKAFHMEANSDSSSSKAPGQGVEISMKCANQTKQKSNLCMDNSPKAEPCFRWVKRLKLSSSHSSARGTKSINLSEGSSRKRNNFFSRSLKGDVTRSKSMATDDSINLSKENLGNDLSLSNVWIQRWLCDGSKSTRQKPYTMVDCESQSLRWASEDLQKDRSPSIRAMALMGKAMKSFQPCQIEKRGSLTIWNTKE